MKVHVDGWLQGYPYAHIPDTDYGEYHLGEKQLFGKNLNGRFFGVEESLARAEEMPITIHTVLDGLWHLGVQSKEYAALMVLTNLMLPRVLRHPHPEITGSLFKDVYAFTPEEILNMSRFALGRLFAQVEDGMVEDHPYNIAHTISTITSLQVLCEYGDAIPDPRDHRIPLNGILTTAAK